MILAKRPRRYEDFLQRRTPPITVRRVSGVQGSLTTDVCVCVCVPFDMRIIRIISTKNERKMKVQDRRSKIDTR